jgi:hypothetical protein
MPRKPHLSATMERFYISLPNNKIMTVVLKIGEAVEPMQCDIERRNVDLTL